MVKIPAVTYSYMGQPHTTIGDASFHFRVRDGIGWYQRSNAAGKTIKQPKIGYD